MLLKIILNLKYRVCMNRVKSMIEILELNKIWKFIRKKNQKKLMNNLKKLLE